MTSPSFSCPHCGKPVRSEESGATAQPDASSLASETGVEREYDHRGVLLPRRTRIGGIIIPQ